MSRPDAYIIDACRTPIGRYGGALKDVRPDDLSAHILSALITRSGISPADIHDVVWGCANQSGEDSWNVGRMAVLLAGLPAGLPATTINRMCGSGLDAVNQAARAVWSGDADVVIAGGVESMSRAPYVIAKDMGSDRSFGNITAYDTAIGWRFPNPRFGRKIPLEALGETAENVFERWHVPREEQDRFALQSHERAVQATMDERFHEELVNVDVAQRRGETVIVAEDEGPRANTSLEKLAKLPPAFRKNGTVTAGNSSPLSDGAAALLIVSAGYAERHGLSPMARIVSTGVSGVDPRIMGIGPVPATKTALEKAGLSMDKVDLVELHEAFAVQALTVIRELGLDEARTNVNGGAIALGHPIGASGARIMTTLVHELAKRRWRYGLATMSVGLGQGISTIIERME